MLDQKKAQLAYEKVFDDWEVDLTGPQEQKFENSRFYPTWQKYAGKEAYASLSLANAVPFMYDMLRLSDIESQQETKDQKRQALTQKEEPS